MATTILAFLVGAMISGLLVFIVTENRARVRQIQAFHVGLEQGYHRGYADGQSGGEPGFDDFRAATGNVASVLAILG